MGKFLNDVTLGCISADRYDRLESLLLSLPILPEQFNILVIDNSKIKKSLERVVEVLEYNGFLVQLVELKFGKSMFRLRQELLDRCNTKFLWLLDDDVVLSGNPLQAFLDVMDDAFGYLQGSKIDIFNRDNVDDWKIYEKYIKITNGRIPCWFYQYDVHGVVDTCVADCGNIFINVPLAKVVGGFKYTGNQSLKNRTGEDVLFGARIASRYPCAYVSNSIVFHLPRKQARFIDKDPKWLWDTIVKECSSEVVERLEQFYKGKFQWEK